MVQSAREEPTEVKMTLPIDGKELVEYMHFLGKGQYFKKNNIAFNSDRFVMVVLYANKQVTKSFQDAYIVKHKTNPYRDLEINKYSEVINNGECIIYSKNNNFMFVFHDFTIITIKILRKNKKNTLVALKKEREMFNDFKRT